MDLRVVEAEHSMEMHLPYLGKVFEGYPVKIVPILVGALNVENEAAYGQLLGKYLDDPSNFFSVSSDFCHWGSRFNYTRYDKKHGAIYKSIEALDKMSMDIIDEGYHFMTKSCSTKIKIKFLRDEQSSQCKSMRESSVSYAAAAASVDA